MAIAEDIWDAQVHCRWVCKDPLRVVMSRRDWRSLVLDAEMRWGPTRLATADPETEIIMFLGMRVVIDPTLTTWKIERTDQ